jgi:transposase InsO family protein
MTHVTHIENLASQLRDLGSPQSDDEVMAKIMGTLPPEFANFDSQWDGLKPEDRTLTYLRARLVQEARKVKQRQNTVTPRGANNDALFSHPSKSNFSQPVKSDDGRNRSGRWCTSCKRNTHWTKDCWSNKKRDRDDDQSGPSAKKQKANVASHSNNVFTLVSTYGLTALPKGKWAADSGATQSISGDRHAFINFIPLEPKTWAINGIGNSTIYARGIGDVPIVSTVNGVATQGVIKDVLYAPDVGVNLLSVASVTSHGYNVNFFGEDCEIEKDGVTFIVGRRFGQSLYLLDISTQSIQEAAKAAMANGASFEIWHERLAHVNYNTMRRMQKLNAVTGLNINGQASAETCEPCILGKMHRAPFPKGRTKAEEVGGIIHSDLNEMNVATPSGKKYYAIFKDDLTGFKEIYFMKHKSELPDCFKAFQTKMFAATGRKPSILRTDGGGEFISNEFEKYLESEGIIHQSSCPHTPQQNGVAERDNRTTVEAIRTELQAKQLPPYLWAAAASYTVYTQNRILQGDSILTPYEQWYGKKPDVSHLRAFGTPAYVHIPDANRRKLDAKASKGIFIGYSETTKGWLVYTSSDHKVVISRDVKFLSERSCCSSIQINQDSSSSQTEQQSSTGGDTHSSDKKSSNKTSPSVAPSEPRRSKRGRIPKKNWPSDLEEKEENSSDPADQEGINSTCAISMALAARDFLYNEPQSYKEAMASKDAPKWKEGTDDEMKSLDENDTYDLVDLPEGQKVLPSRWHFKAKRDKDGNIVRYKARFVAKGFKQKKFIDYGDLWSPVARMDSLRVITSVAASKDLHLFQIDVQTAFLHGEIDREIYVHQPEGYVVPGSEKKVWRLKKGLYGLRQSAVLWNKRIHKTLIRLGFVQSTADPCVYTRMTGGVTMILALWVDDGLFAFSDMEAGQSVIDALQTEFKIRVSPVEHFVGLVINRDRTNKSLHLSSPAYIDKLLEKFSMSECNPVKIPADKSVDLSKSMAPDTEEMRSKMTQYPYRQLIGSLMYAAITIRPDIAYIVNQLAQFCEDPGEKHWQAAKKVLRYLSATRRFGISFSGGTTNQLIRSSRFPTLIMPEASIHDAPRPAFSSYSTVVSCLTAAENRSALLDQPWSQSILLQAKVRAKPSF